MVGSEIFINLTNFISSIGNNLKEFLLNRRSKYKGFSNHL